MNKSSVLYALACLAGVLCCQFSWAKVAYVPMFDFLEPTGQDHLLYGEHGTHTCQVGHTPVRS